MVLSKVECVCVVCPRIYTQHHHQRIITALTLSQTLTYLKALTFSSLQCASPHLQAATICSLDLLN